MHAPLHTQQDRPTRPLPIKIALKPDVMTILALYQLFLIPIPFMLIIMGQIINSGYLFLTGNKECKHLLGTALSLFPCRQRGKKITDSW